MKPPFIWIRQPKAKAWALLFWVNSFPLARADEKVHTLLALIVDTNIASIKLHEKFGFANVGTFKEVSYKLGHWINLTHLQLML